MDMAITKGTIRPVIVVIPYQKTIYGGSLYTNSTIAGN